MRAPESKRKIAQRFFAWSREGEPRPTGDLQVNPIDGAIYSRRRHRAGKGTLMGLIIGIIIVILLLGLLFKLLKIAIVIALVVGGLMLVQNKFGGKQLK